MTIFDFWSPELNNFLHAKLPRLENKKSISKYPERILIKGDSFSGKTTLVNELLNRFYLDKSPKTIIKLTELESGLIEYKDLMNNSSKDYIGSFLDNKFDLGFAQIDITLNLIDLVYKKLLKKTKTQIIWFENVRLDGNLNQDKIHKLMNFENGIKKIIIITTSEDVVFDYYHSNSSIDFIIPDLNYDTYKHFMTNRKSKINSYKNSLMYKLSELDTQKIKLILLWGKNQYGLVKKLYEFFNKNNIRNEKNTTSLYSLLFDVETDSELEKLLLYILMYPQYMTFEKLNFFNFSADYDFVEKVEWLILKECLLNNNDQFKIDTVLEKEKNQYIENFSNRRLKRDASLTIDSLLRKYVPERYDLRAKNASFFSTSKEQEYWIIHKLRGGKIPQSILFSKEHRKVLLCLEKFEASSNDGESDIDLIFKNILQDNYGLLIEAELHYYYINIVLKCKNRTKKFIELANLFNELFNYYNDLKEKQEDEMRIKIGLFLAPQLVNVLNDQMLSQSKNIYKEIGILLRKKMKGNKNYYVLYSVFYKFISTFLLPYRECYFILCDLLEDIKTQEVIQNNVKIDKVFPQIYTNLLGVSFYLTKKDIEEALAYNFSDFEQEYIDNFKVKEYKIINNIVLSNILLSFKETDFKEKLNTGVDRLKKYNDNSIIKNNLAGIYFYLGLYKKAKKNIDEMLKNNLNDDFYKFYGNYNLAIINLFLDDNKEFSETVQKSIDLLSKLQIPSLIIDVSVSKALILRIRNLITIIKSIEKKDLLELENLLYTKIKPKEIIFQPLWIFSDYQYWD